MHFEEVNVAEFVLKMIPLIFGRTSDFLRERPIWNMGQKKTNGRRETSLEAYEMLFLADNEDLNKAQSVGIKVVLIGKLSEVIC